LYYNKTIFDELNLAYPTNGMSWDEVFDLAWKITEHPLLGKRAALKIPEENLVFSQFHIRIFNPETGLPNTEDPLWVKQSQFMERLRELYEYNPAASSHYLYSEFFNGNIAMIAGRYKGDSSHHGNRTTQGL